MRADALLPEEIRPPAVHSEMTPLTLSGPSVGGAGAREVEGRDVLLTGATGYLGAHLLAELCRRTDARVHCLVRGGDVVRLRRALASYGLWDEAFLARIAVVAGDLRQPRLGLTEERFLELARRSDAVIHSAAAVNWVFPYASLREENVLGTRELLRLACLERPSAFHLVSTQAVCHAMSAPAVVDERTPLLPHLERMHMGYARSKCVAEALAEAAARRGLDVRIYRPPFLFGSEARGVATPDDFLAALVKGCLELGLAPDIDWTVETCAVDETAALIVDVAARPADGPRVLHMAAGPGRPFRELVLFLGLYGYALELVPLERWLAAVDRESRAPKHALHVLRSFLLRRIPEEGLRTQPELFLEPHRRRISRALSDEALRGRPAAALTPLGAGLLDRIVTGWVERGFLPAPDGRKGRRTREIGREVGRGHGHGQGQGHGHGHGHEAPSSSSKAARLEDVVAPEEWAPLLRAGMGAPSLEVVRVEARGRLGDSSIITELTSWRQRRALGLLRCRVHVRASGGAAVEALDAVVKAKPTDEEVIDVAVDVARSAGERLGRAFESFRGRLGFTGCDLRELAIYERGPRALLERAPRVYGVLRDPSRSGPGHARGLEHAHTPGHAHGHEVAPRRVLVLEDLSGAHLLDAADDVARWGEAEVDAAVDGIAAVHAATLGRAPPDLGLAPFETALERASMAELWVALAEHARPFTTDAGGPALAALHDALASDVAAWRRPLDDAPKSLVHNDCNPRNVALVRVGTGLALRAYDWELAAAAPPQRDLAELLAFVLPPDVEEARVRRLVERHRLAIERGCALEGGPGLRVDADLWHAGFRAALADLLVDRLALYAVAHRFRRQRFLPRVLATWARLFRYFPAV